MQSQKRIRLSDQMFFLGIINSEEVSYEMTEVAVDFVERSRTPGKTMRHY